MRWGPVGVRGFLHAAERCGGDFVGPVMFCQEVVVSFEGRRVVDRGLTLATRGSMYGEQDGRG